jgi:predicted RNA-binding Zn-ribbon protein involved in translation (DUF1610 family)
MINVVTTSDGRATPTSCPQCGDAAGVRPVVVRRVEPGVRYWGCDKCGLVWGVIARRPE